jgi:hypothetical protein
MILNKNQVDSLELLIKKEFSPLDISFQNNYFERLVNVDVHIFVRHNEKIKIIYIAIPLRMNENFSRLQYIHRFAESLAISNRANFVSYFTCFFDGEEAVLIEKSNLEYQIMKNWP